MVIELYCCAKDCHPLDTMRCLPRGSPVYDAESTRAHAHGSKISERFDRCRFVHQRNHGAPRYPISGAVRRAPPGKRVSPADTKTNRWRALECFHSHRAHEIPRETSPRGGVSSRSRRGSLARARRAAEHDERLWDSGCGSLRHSINLAVLVDPWPKQQQEQRVGLCCAVATAVCCVAGL